IALHPSNDLRFLRPPFEFSKRAAGESAEFRRGGVELLGMIGLARLECREPAAEASELIRRQLGDGFGDFFDLHVSSIVPGWVRERDRAPSFPSELKCMRARRETLWRLADRPCRNFR